MKDWIIFGFINFKTEDLTSISNIAISFHVKKNAILSQNYTVIFEIISFVKSINSTFYIFQRLSVIILKCFVSKNRLMASPSIIFY